MINENTWHLKITTMPAIVRALDIVKKAADKHINKIHDSLSLYEKNVLC